MTDDDFPRPAGATGPRPPILPHTHGASPFRGPDAPPRPAPPPYDCGLSPEALREIEEAADRARKSRKRR